MACDDFDFSKYDEEIVKRLCEEYESLWLIDVCTGRAYVYQANEATANMEAIAMVKNELITYEASRLYYIENCIASHHRQRMIEETSVEHILENISDGGLYFVDYKRIFEGKTNYNQLVFAKIKENENGITHFMMGFRDIDKSKKAERDELTGLFTRKAFIEHASRTLKNNPDKKYNLIISDIVDFKQINETFGVLEGDRILRCTGQFLHSFATGDMIVGRYGGDQFALLISADESAKRSDNNTSMVDFYMDVVEKEKLPHYVVKFGVYEDVEHDASITTICDYAHVALNSIKNDYSKITAVYDDNLKKKLATQRKIENCMNQALSEGQFKVFYQPKHDTATGKLVGAEALVRWVHPEYGFMSPGDFIPIFEQNGFVTEVDLFVWRRTCENLRRWMDEGKDIVPVSVNASRMDFKRTGMTEKIEQYVRDNNIPREYLHIEVTESLLEDDMVRLIDKLEKIRDLGYKVELDDFGAGYSSVNFLSQLPLDVVKLDMSFMRDIDDVKRKRVLAACISMAKNLGYETVSEGVETDEQLELLKILGADMIQGYYFSKPLPEEDFEKYLEKYARG